MYCYHHPDLQAVGACIECSKAVCPECKVEFDHKIYCNSCIEKKISCPASNSSTSSVTGNIDNTSGMGSKALLPAGLGDWNWGGLLLTWIWGIGNNVWWSFLVFIPWLGLLVIPWVLAFKGNEWAWQSKRWDSLEHFKKVQHTWAIWGWAVNIAGVVILLLLMFAGLGLLLWALQKYGFK
jgi:hypothetical protein